MERKLLIEAAVAANENYRVDAGDPLELGFLYGTAEMVVMVTIQEGENYHDLREAIAREIDAKAALASYAVLDPYIDAQNAP